MSTGLDRLAAGHVEGLDGARIALLTNHTAVDAWGRHAVQVLRTRPGLEIVRLLGPEHGVWSTHQDMEAVDGVPIDGIFQLPVVSLYGDQESSLTPQPQCFEGIDAVVYDLQDIGTRFYTYASSLALVMDAAADAGVPVWVLDRPNPLGNRREGPLLRPGFESFCGIQAGQPIRHGMTVGALAQWFKRERSCDVELHVVPCDRRARLPFAPTSPNMPDLNTALVYPGMCLLEATTVSEGRGTTTPFLLFGAPGVDPLRLAETLRAHEIPGIDFLPRMFRPEFGKHAHTICGGVYLRVFDHSCILGVPLGLHVLDALREVAPEQFGWREAPYEFRSDIPAIDLLWGSDVLRTTLESGALAASLIATAMGEGRAFRP